MEALILDKNWDATAILDTFESFIWSDRCRGYGDFEIYLPAAHPLVKEFKMGYYLMLRGSDRLMVIETIEIDTDVEDGDKATITGRSLESLLDRRIVSNRTTLSGSLQDGIQQLLNENAINPAKTARKIPGLVFKKSTDSRITSLTIDTQFYGENLYDAIDALCSDSDICYSVTPNFGSNQLVFTLYAGEDRSYDQEKLPWVVFSPGLENLMSTKYIESKVDYANVALILGDDRDVEEGETEVADPYWTITGDDSASGLDRKEIFVDASSTSRRYYDAESSESVMLSDEAYYTILEAKGSEALSLKKEVSSFTGEVAQTSQFVLNEDFFIGDIVQIDNGYGKELKVTITEITFSQDASGESITPTFASVEDEEGG